MNKKFDPSVDALFQAAMAQIVKDAKTFSEPSPPSEEKPSLKQSPEVRGVPPSADQQVLAPKDTQSLAKKLVDARTNFVIAVLYLRSCCVKPKGRKGDVIFCVAGKSPVLGSEDSIQLSKKAVAEVGTEIRDTLDTLNVIRENPESQAFLERNQQFFERIDAQVFRTFLEQQQDR